MPPVPPKKLHLSTAEVKHHNAATKRKMLEHDVASADKQPMVDYPAIQKSCSPRCTKPGCVIITKEERQNIYQTFFAMTDDEKYLFETLLMSSEDAVPVPGSKTRMSWTYKLPVMYAKLDVCQTTFKTTINVSDAQIGRIQKRMVESSEVFPRNMRGRHTTRPHKMVDETIEKIQEHLKSYDQQDNHYSRNRYESEVKFLSPSLTIFKIYTEYMEQNAINNAVSESTFRKLFHALNYKIGNPYDDTCDTCDLLAMQLKSSTDEEIKSQLQQQKQAHLTLADLTSNSRKMDALRSKEDQSFVVLTVDMQQTFFTPQLTNSSAFYLRKFSTYNLGIHNEQEDKGYMFLWNETDARKGADEVASCLFKFITSKYVPLQPVERRTLVVWSDRCVGQNNNFSMLILYRALIEKKLFTDVYQKFAVSGHSYLSCDTDFAFIERQMKRNPPKSPLDIPNNIAMANSVTPFEVFQMTQEDFYDLTPVENYFKRPPKLKVSQYLWFHQKDESLNKIFTKSNHKEDETTEEFVLKTRIDLADNRGMPEINCKRKYDGPVALKAAKKTDLRKLLKFLPFTEQNYFNQILSSQAINCNERSEYLDNDEDD